MISRWCGATPRSGGDDSRDCCWPAPSASAQNKPEATAIAPCDKPGGLGLSRIVEIDTTGGPGFGFEHFKQYDFLRDKGVGDER
jgi:hypothetical protein